MDRNRNKRSWRRQERSLALAPGRSETYFSRERIIVVKKLIALLLVVGLLVAAAGCGGPATTKKADTPKTTAP
jgi:hypothetical protein